MTVSIIIPAYNSEKFIKRCLDSVINQIYKNLEIIVIDDASKDNTKQIIKEYAEKDNRIRPFYSSENKGVSFSRNIGLKASTGEYIMFVDSDDIIAPNSIQTLMETAILYNAEIVEGSYQDFDSNGIKNTYCHVEKTCIYNSFNYFGFPWGKIIRSDCLKNFCFPEEFLFEDTVMSTLLYPECHNTYAIPDVVYYYRDNSAGITNTCITSLKCIDTFWIMKYCLEERVRRGQSLQERDLERYLFAIYRNWGRTRGMPYDIQESIFLLTCKLIETAFGAIFREYSGKYMKIFRTVKFRSFDAFLTLASNGYIE